MVKIPYFKPNNCRDCIMYDREHDWCKLSRQEVEEPYKTPDWCEIQEAEEKHNENQRRRL